jgi:ABC-type transport system involved in multi-copper enzyme maturation permease subunit
MIWFTWRQYRTQAVIVIVALLVITSILLMTGMHIASFVHHLGDKLGKPGCQTDTCSTAQNALQQYVENTFGGAVFYNVFQTLLRALPLLLGMFVGVQVVAPELEQGTYRLIWTQSITWSRWLRIKISALLVCLLAGMGLLVSIFLWWKVPNLFPSINLWGYENYEVWSPVMVAYTLFALALGICAGTVIKKAVPAMAVTMVIFVIMRLLIAVYWRPYFVPPMVVHVPWVDNRGPISGWDLWIKGETVDRQGNRYDFTNGPCKEPSGMGSLEHTPSRATLYRNMALPLMNVTLPMGKMSGPGGSQGGSGDDPQTNAFNKCMTAHGIQNKYTYQPADRFWLFQEFESGIYVVLSALLLAFTFWWIRFRIIGRQR